MLLVLPLATAIVCALAWRYTAGWQRQRVAVGIVALAYAIRLVAVLVIYMSVRYDHGGEGLWLNDEAGFFRATAALLPNPLDQALPLGLDHLGGTGYLGLTTSIALATGAVDVNALRVTNAALGALMVLLCMLEAQRLFGGSAGIIVGVTLAIWPTLVLWSSVMLRDTLGAFALLCLWWSLAHAREIGRVRLASAVILSLALLDTLRTYLAMAALIGVAAWAAYPVLRRLRPRVLLGLAAGVIVGGLALGVSQARRLDFSVHELVYRQTVTRMETLKLLYTDFPPPDPANLPIKPGTAVAIADRKSGWLLTGVVQDVPRNQVVRVAFTDESIREVPLDEVVPIESATIPPLQLVAWVGPNLVAFLTGVSMTSASSSPAWVFDSLAWDVLAILAVVTAARARLSAREWVYPLAIVAGTALALIAVPGAPGNADRHQATQTLPLLVVFAAPLLSSGARKVAAVAGLPVNNPSSKPVNAPIAATSRIRSAR